MEKLIEIVKKVADKYMEKTNLIIEKNSLTLEYFIFKNGEKDLYKTLQIEEFEDKLKVIIFPEKIEKVVDIAGLEDILLILEKQCDVKRYTQEEIEQIKIKYPQNTKIRLIKMYDLQAPEPGTIGYVSSVDGIGQIHVRWDNRSSLALNRNDEFEILCPICGKPLKDKSHLLFKVGDIKPFAYGNIVYLGKIIAINEENTVYTMEEVESKKVYEISQEYVFLGDD